MVLDRKGMLDRAQEKIISRKFIVFILATVLLFLGHLSEDQWALISSVYIGTEAAIDGVATFIKTKRAALAVVSSDENEEENADA